MQKITTVQKQVVSALLCGNWQDFNWHDASRRSSAIAELLVHSHYTRQPALAGYQLKPEDFVRASFTINLPLLMATSAYWLGRRQYSPHHCLFPLRKRKVQQHKQLTSPNCDQPSPVYQNQRHCVTNFSVVPPPAETSWLSSAYERVERRRTNVSYWQLSAWSPTMYTALNELKCTWTVTTCPACGNYKQRIHVTSSIKLMHYSHQTFQLIFLFCSVKATHTHTHPFNGPFSGTTRVGRYQKGKTNLDFTEARDSEWQWHQLGHMQVCTSLQTDNHASTPPLSFFTGRMPFLPLNQQRQSTEGTV